jgi:hypothetical protein
MQHGFVSLKPPAKSPSIKSFASQKDGMIGRMEEDGMGGWRRMG